MFSYEHARAYSINIPVKNGTLEIHSIEKEDGIWFFLPSFANVSFLFDQKEFDLKVEESEEGLRLAEFEGEQFYIAKSQNLRTMFIYSDDPVSKGREYIENDASHKNEATGMMILVNKEGTVDYAGRLRQIRGRGNSTWTLEKKPYQIKLKDKFDLLNTGDSSEKNQTWILLADAVDASLLHNRIALDLAKEMGLSETAHCEHVDLYYDGEYRGTYLLTEKVEIGEGRVEEVDYDKIIKKWNKWVGNNDLSLLPRAKGLNNYGDPICYIEGLADNGINNAGAYLIEMYARGTADTLSGFTLATDRAFELTSPKYASKNMVCYVSQLLSDGLAALQNGGFHPETGESVDKWFDFESFARVILLNELTRNWDAFTLTSTYFLLPAQETKFIAGPVWDFDRTMRNPKYRNEGGYTWGLKDSEWKCWASEFYAIPEFMECAQRIYRDEIHPLVMEILLGNQKGQYLRPLNEYVQEIRPSALMNNYLWPVQDTDYNLHYADSFDTDVEYLRQFLEQRNEWMYQTFTCNGQSDADHINITMKAEWAYVEEPLDFLVFPWSKVTVESYSHDQLSEATEENYALWHVKLVLAPQEGYRFENPRVWINNGHFSGEVQADGTLVVDFLFEDLTYRPVDCYGEDIGLVFNPDFYAFNYPEVAKACQNDPQLLMEHFYYEGIYEGYIGNGFFDPKEMVFFHPDLKNTLGEDWSAYYWDFIYYGYEIEGWMDSVDSKFVPPVYSYPSTSDFPANQ